MGFFKKLFTGIGFAAGFLFYGCLSMILALNEIQTYQFNKKGLLMDE